MSEKFVKETKEEKREEKSSLNIRTIAFLGLGAISVGATSFRDEIDLLLREITGPLAMRNVEDRVAKLSLDERIQYEKKSNMLIKKVGPNYLGTIVNREASSLEPKEVEIVEPTISGFEQTNQVTNEDMRKATSTSFFPQGWMKQFASIAYVHKVVSLGENIFQRGQNTLKDKGDEIVLFDMVMDHEETDAERLRYMKLWILLNVLQHETCHSNDWWTRAPRTFTDRIELLSRVIERTESDDAYSEHVVSDAQGFGVPYHSLYKSDDIRLQKIVYAEYFADICREYLSDQEDFKKRYPKDWAIVDEWIKKYDPEFNKRALPPGPFSRTYGTVVNEWKNVFN